MKTKRIKFGDLKFRSEKQIPYNKEEKSIIRTKSKEALIERLKEMAEKEKILSPRPTSAECYCLSYRRREKVEDFTCPVCESVIAVYEEEKENFSQIEKLVGQMKELGCDVKTKNICNACYGQGKHPNRVVTLFYIRLEEMPSYHVSASNNVEDYENILSFLRKDENYFSQYNVEVIHKMLGITFPRLAVLINANCDIVPKWTRGYHIDSYSLFNLYPYINLKYKKTNIGSEGRNELELFFNTYQPKLTFIFMNPDKDDISEYSEIIPIAKEYNSIVLCIIDQSSFIHIHPLLIKGFRSLSLTHYYNCKEFIKRIDFDFALFTEWVTPESAMIKCLDKLEYVNKIITKVEQLLQEIQNNNDHESIINNIKAAFKDKESIMNDLDNFIEQQKQIDNKE